MANNGYLGWTMTAESDVGLDCLRSADIATMVEIQAKCPAIAALGVTRVRFGDDYGG
jgi:hypothetical protein